MNNATGTAVDANILALMERIQMEQKLLSQQMMGQRNLNQSYTNLVNPIESYLERQRQAADEHRQQDQLVNELILANGLQGIIGNGQCDLSSLVSGYDHLGISTLQAANLMGSGAGYSLMNNAHLFNSTRVNSGYQEGHIPFGNNQSESEAISSVVCSPGNLSLAHYVANVHKPDSVKSFLGQSFNLGQGLGCPSASAYPTMSDYMCANVALSNAVENQKTRANLINSIKKKNTTRHPRPKKPKDMPKRPLSAYNIFFKEERESILASISIPSKSSWKNKSNEGMDDKLAIIHQKTSLKNGGKKPHGKIGFENLAKIIGQRWQNLPPSSVQRCKALALEDMKRYKLEMQEYNDRKAKKQQECDDSSSSDNGSDHQESNNIIKKIQQQQSLPDKIFSRLNSVEKADTSAPLKKRL